MKKTIFKTICISFLMFLCVSVISVKRVHAAEETPQEETPQEEQTNPYLDLLQNEGYQFANYVITALVGFLSAISTVIIMIGKIKASIKANTAENNKLSNTSQRINTSIEKTNTQLLAISSKLEKSNQNLMDRQAQDEKTMEDMQKRYDVLESKYDKLIEDNEKTLQVLKLVYSNDPSLVSSGKAKEIVEIVGDVNVKEQEAKED